VIAQILYSGVNVVSLADLTGIVSAIAAIAAAIFVVIQLRHMNKHSDLEITMKIFEWAETDRLRKAFRWVETKFHFQDYERYRAEVSQDFEEGDYPYQVEAFFEQVGFLVNKSFVDIDVIVDRLGGLIVSNWRKLEPWILAVRKERDDRTFGEHFQTLYEKTVEYMAKR
jgi:hypothetical protein